MNAIIYVINLQRATERRQSMMAQLKKTTLPFEFIDAVNTTTSENYNYKVINRYKRKLVKTEVACFLSHIKVKQHFLNSSYDYAIILEDDITLLDNFDIAITAAMQHHKTLAKKHQWDVLKLTDLGPRKLVALKTINNNYSLYGGSVVITTQAAIWSRNGAQQFLKHAIKNNTILIKMPIDCALQMTWQYGLKIYNIVPHLISAVDFESQIRPGKRLKSDTLMRLNYEFNKSIPKFFMYLRATLFKY